MGSGCSSLSYSSSSTCNATVFSISSSPSSSSSLKLNPSSFLFQNPKTLRNQSPLRCGRSFKMESQKPIFDLEKLDDEFVQKLVYDALVWSSLHGLVVGDKSYQKSGNVPGVGLMHAPIALLPTAFPEAYWKQACNVTPLFNELIDRVSLDGKFLQDSLSRTKKVDVFTSRLLDIHSKMLERNKKEDIRLGLHRFDYMLDEETNSLLQIEMNTISCSFPGLSRLVSQLHQSLLRSYGDQIGIDSERVPINTSTIQFADALAKAWLEYSNPRAVVMVIVQPEERNMYDQHLLSSILREKHNIVVIRKTLAEVEKEGSVQEDETLIVGGQAVAVVYFRSGYTPNDHPSESEWNARLLIEESSAVKCPSIAYHLTGSKKIQQELAKPGVLERFLDNKEDIAKLRKCFAGLWSLDDSEIVKQAIEKPGLFVMKPQREGGGNNIYGDDVRENLLRLQKEGEEGNAAYILMQRIFPKVSNMFLVREGVYHKHQAISELGVYGAYLRSKDEVIVNEQSGYLMRTKIASSDEGGVAAGFGVLDSIYLI
ncbi:glutathione synthetase 2 [Arabidopsis thaliana]|uniref:Glutathione synthetase, chloroplastic n=2 Tax=Arabidopsis thaliana TaxID=3702 RepID=GSHB_ARATH|nr:glutathione synthetase 2 [Arabidopsis thaliana]P46416.3 RecName: Full=Glutathione synthetase, chloroplastic; Short=GSH synthetase; Short=GSH-S; Short=Glutathione synthase; Flags: Precursor [Arabidopsis thaliana]AED93678.1 glutathione synthetase 2 [Arabidopsis thaliana]|eukprot:NP_568495.2 glutathione synthetase 2 [Arabidopsis thaliana]